MLSLSQRLVRTPSRLSIVALALTGAISVSGFSGAAKADEALAPPAWLDTVKFSGHLDTGITFNPAAQTGSENMGNLFNDKANQLMLNQLMATVERPIDPKSSTLDLGFRLQGMFGTDARMTHGFAEMDHLIDDRNQIDVVEASFSAHIPALTEGGLDVKIGQFPTPMGAEVIDATGNYLYSHSYIYNYGIPLKNTGVLATLHATPVLDLYGGVDTGVNAFITDNGYNNSILKGQFGFGLNLLEGNLTILGFSHIGAENPNNAPVPKGSLRYLNDITTTWKINDDWTFVNDINYIADDGLGAIGYGVAQYGIYSLNKNWSLIGRAEIWRDNGGVYVAAFPGHFDYVNSERGLPATIIPAARTTYGALTLGANYKPEVPKIVEGLIIRPELRIDHALNGSHIFDIGNTKMGNDTTSFTPAIDIVIPF